MGNACGSKPNESAEQKQQRTEFLEKASHEELQAIVKKLKIPTSPYGSSDTLRTKINAYVMDNSGVKSLMHSLAVTKELWEAAGREPSEGPVDVAEVKRLIDAGGDVTWVTS
jgi:hypothetical protein